LHLLKLSLKALPGKPAVVPDRVMHEEFNAQLRVCPENVGDCPHFARQSAYCDTSRSKMGTVPLAFALSGQTLTSAAAGANL
jgi:hypothetical protein